MEFGKEKCVMLIMRSAKQKMKGGTKLSIKEKIRTFRKNENSKNLRIVEADTIKHAEMKENFFKKIRYLGLFLKWTWQELQQRNQRTRKLMAMHEALHAWDDVDRLYVSRKRGWRGPSSILDSVDASIRLEDCIKKAWRKDWLQPPETIQTPLSSKEQKLLEKIEKKGNCMDVLNDKQVKSHTRKLGHG